MGGGRLSGLYANRAEKQASPQAGGNGMEETIDFLP